MFISKKTIAWGGFVLFSLALAACGATSETTIQAPTAAPTEAVVEPPEESSDIEAAPEATATEAPLFACGGQLEWQIAQGVADLAEVSQDEVMALYCDGQPFSQISLAYQTAASIGISGEEVLAGLDAGMDWQQLWSDVDMPLDECGTEDDQDIADSIASTYEQPYQLVMSQFCLGYEFEDILLAMETSAQSEAPAPVLLYWLGNGASWEQIWSDLGIVE